MRESPQKWKHNNKDLIENIPFREEIRFRECEFSSESRGVLEINVIMLTFVLEGMLFWGCAGSSHVNRSSICKTRFRKSPLTGENLVTV